MANETQPRDRSSVGAIYVVSAACLVFTAWLVRASLHAWETNTKVNLNNRLYWPWEGFAISVLMLAIGIAGIWTGLSKAKE